MASLVAKQQYHANPANIKLRKCWQLLHHYHWCGAVSGQCRWTRSNGKRDLYWRCLFSYKPVTRWDSSWVTPSKHDRCLDKHSSAAAATATPPTTSTFALV